MRVQRQYNESFRQQALEKVYGRGSRSVREVAEDLNMSKGTLRNWMKTDKNSSSARVGRQSKRPKDWSLTERLQMLMESHGLDEEALNAFCREKGVFRHHLEQWQVAFTAGGAEDPRAELRELKDTNKALTRELNRKEKALAEAAALLVLQKKYQAANGEGVGRDWPIIGAHCEALESQPAKHASEIDHDRAGRSTAATFCSRVL